MALAAAGAACLLLPKPGSWNPRRTMFIFRSLCSHVFVLFPYPSVRSPIFDSSTELRPTRQRYVLRPTRAVATALGQPLGIGYDAGLRHGWMDGMSSPPKFRALAIFFKNSTFSSATSHMTELGNWSNTDCSESPPSSWGGG